jgi:hypothetical protein
MAILGLSAARELSTERPVDNKNAAPRQRSAMHKDLFITYLLKITGAKTVPQILRHPSNSTAQQ